MSEEKTLPSDLKVEVLFESPDLLILNKPSGLPSQPLPKDLESNGSEAPLLDRIHHCVEVALQLAPQMRNVVRKDPLGRSRPGEFGLLHRLDVGTSGALVFAKTQSEMDRLLPLWKTQAIKKIYRALCTQSLELKFTPPLPPPQALLSVSLPHLIEMDLGRSAKSSKKVIPYIKNRVRGPALFSQTRVLSIKKGGYPTLDTPVWDFQIQIDTGVMHQIRVVLSHHGFPILGDLLYRGAPASRLFLHHAEIELPLLDGSPLKVTAPLPSAWPQF